MTLIKLITQFPKVSLVSYTYKIKGLKTTSNKENYNDILTSKNTMTKTLNSIWFLLIMDLTLRKKFI